MKRLRIPFALSLLLSVIGFIAAASVPPEVRISFHNEGKVCLETANSSFSILQVSGEISNLSYWCSTGATEETGHNKGELVFVVSADQFCLVSDTPVFIVYDAGYGNTWGEEVENFCFGMMNLSSPVHNDGETYQSGFYY